MSPGYFADYIKMQNPTDNISFETKWETYFQFNLKGFFFPVYIPGYLL